MTSQAAELLLKEAPAGHAFKLHKTTIEIRNLPELAEALEIMSGDSFAHHANAKKNDFATWVKEIIHDDELSNRLRGVTDKNKTMQIVKDRLKETSTHAGQTAFKSTLFGFGLWDVVVGFITGLVIGVLLGHFMIPKP